MTLVHHGCDGLLPSGKPLFIQRFQQTETDGGTLRHRVQDRLVKGAISQGFGHLHRDDLSSAARLPRKSVYGRETLPRFF
jgi:hypothetical protein